MFWATAVLEQNIINTTWILINSKHRLFILNNFIALKKENSYPHPRTTDGCVKVTQGGFLERSADSDVGQSSSH